MAGERLRWRDPGWEPVGDGDLAGLCVVDSWLMHDGYMRAPERHARRFAAACAETCSIPPGQTTEFFWSAVARVPLSGRWFPRVELVEVAGMPRLQVWIRLAPTRGDTVRLWAGPAGDRRTRPVVKGPDLGHLADLRAAAVEHGADEALILSAAAGVLEGASTSILWWRDDVLCAPPQNGRVLPGVTRAVLFQLAAAAGIATRCETPSPADLDGLETWAVNALHGIRPVTGWLGTPVRPGSADRLNEWNVRLEQTAVHASARRLAAARTAAN